MKITLTNPAAAGICVSESLSEQTQALVRVVCRTGQFVNIAPREGKPFLGTHGGAYRYVVRKGSALAALLDADATPYVGAGTVTSLRIYNADGRDGPLEMLVSF